MAVEVGFFDSFNGDRVYNADFMMRMFEGFYTEGVFPWVGSQFSPGVYSTGFKTRVMPGKAYLNKHFVYCDAPFDIQLPPPPVVNSRWDTIVLFVDQYQRRGGIEARIGEVSVYPDKYTAQSNELKLFAFKRTPNETKLNAQTGEVFIGRADTPWVARLF